MSRTTSTVDPSETLYAGITVAIVAVATLGWFFMYVQPREEFLGQVMECMGNDNSEAAYDRCAEEIRTSAVRSSTSAASL